MEPTDTAGEDRFPVKISRLKLGRGFVAAIVENHGSAHALAAVTIDGCHVRALDPVVLETFVERFHAHSSHALCNQVADGIIYHSASDTSLESKAIREIGSDI